MDSWDEESTDYMNNNGEMAKPTDFYLGLSLAIASSAFIGASFIIKKKALIKLQKYGGLRAGAGGFGYLRELVWWAGLLSMGIGEAANFAAYAFSPATLVTPLGALSVLVSAILASKFLNEHLNLLGKIGCFLCMLGSTVLVIHSPKEEEISTMENLAAKMQDFSFIIYTLCVLTACISIIFYFGPRYGKNNIIVYILLCSSCGSLTVMCCKGIGISLRESIDGKNEMGNWLTWALLFSLVFFIMLQMNYLNKSLDLFNTSIVTPIYYVFFTTFVIIASAILFKEWSKMSFEDVLGCLCGFMTIIIAIFLLNAFKDLDVSYSDVRQIFRPKKEISSLNSSRKSIDSLDERGQIRYDVERNYGSSITRSM
ncbi:magnesium transporter NIPA2 [Copidosoma floridanum]|uniref:magnesium transporter NIPA2 n=1 Tax=Copidosoma floridanum TaxID=29053 RepID=UPI0006C9A844|nr:magnesium transporter NIPA2 [Copidosoma floridanum]